VAANAVAAGDEGDAWWVQTEVVSGTASLSTPAMLDGSKFTFPQEAYVAVPRSSLEQPWLSDGPFAKARCSIERQTNFVPYVTPSIAAPIHLTHHLPGPPPPSASTRISTCGIVLWRVIMMSHENA
jgi:hypothetical protein